MSNEKKDIKFEEQVKQLEEMIAKIESGNIELEESIDLYVDAMKLAKECDDKLKRFEEKVNKIALENGKLEDFNIEEEV